MNLRQSVYDNLISRSASLFTRYGFKVITLDDISTECGISKKTIYSFFENKTDLVKRVVAYELLRFRQNLEQIRDQSHNAIEEQMNLISVIVPLSFRMSPTLRRDLAKFYQEAFLLIEDFREEYLISFFCGNIERGISEGLYLDGFNSRVIAHLRVMQIEALLYKTLSMPQDIATEHIARQLNCHYISGLSTPKGFKVLKKYNTHQQ